MALAKIGKPAAKALVGILEHLPEFVPDPSESTVVTIPRFRLADGCVKTLAKLADVGLDALVKLLDHPYEFIRVNVINTLGETNSPLALDPFIQLLREAPRGVVSSAAARALGELGNHVTNARVQVESGEGPFVHPSFDGITGAAIRRGGQIHRRRPDRKLEPITERDTGRTLQHCPDNLVSVTTPCHCFHSLHRQVNVHR